MRWLVVALTVWAVRALGPVLAPRLSDRTRTRLLAVLVPTLLAAIVADAVLAGAADAPLAVPTGFAAGALLLLVGAPLPAAALAACGLAALL